MVMDLWQVCLSKAPFGGLGSESHWPSCKDDTVDGGQERSQASQVQHARRRWSTLNTPLGTSGTNKVVDIVVEVDFELGVVDRQKPDTVCRPSTRFSLRVIGSQEQNGQLFDFRPPSRTPGRRCILAGGCDRCV